MRTPRRGFTLTELLVVISLIVIILAIAIPTFSFITGTRSIDGAQNQISAMLGRARSEAIGLQQITGVMFFLDPVTQRINVAVVNQTGRPAGTGGDTDNPEVDVYLDLSPNHEFLTLPAGVLLQTVDNAVVGGTPPARDDDGYIGFNVNNDGNTAQTDTIAAYGGVILFNGDGHIISRRYAFRTYFRDAANNRDATEMGKLLYAPPRALNGLVETDIEAIEDVVPAPNGTTDPPYSQIGFVLFEREPFENRTDGSTLADAQIDGRDYDNDTPIEENEEIWIDENATPVLVNRYNGTLVRGE